MSTESAAIESYADRALGFWADGFDSGAKDLLNTVFEKTVTPSELQAFRDDTKEIAKKALAAGAIFATCPEYPSVSWVINEAEKRKTCSTEEAAFLREQFVNQGNDLPVVLAI